MGKVSIIIPSHHCKYAAQTVADLFAKATGDIEVIVVLDGWWPDPPIADHKNLTLIHRFPPLGMRQGINAAARIAKGDYLMKCDDHCIFGEGFDEILQADCDENWMSIPTRYSFDDPDNWIGGPGKSRIGPTEYLFMTFPYYKDNQFGMGLHGKKWLGDHEGKEGNPTRTGSWYYYERSRKDILIDDIIAIQGSCWFMPRKHFLRIGGLDEVHSYLIHQEPQELTFKTWLSGGRMVINKKTWYAHWHKSEVKRGIRMSRAAQYATEQYGSWYWMNDKWPLATRKMKWLLEKFLPMPGWPENWEEEKIKYELTNPEFGADYVPRVFDPDGVDGLPVEAAKEIPFEEGPLLTIKEFDPEMYRKMR